MKKKTTSATVRKLTDAEFRSIVRELHDNAKRMGGDVSIWSSRTIAAYIRKKHGVDYHPGNIWRRLKKLGWRFPHSSATQSERLAKIREQGRRTVLIRHS